jgi:hypothetical protein
MIKTMKPEIKDHPGVRFGRWLRSERRASGVVSRVFAGRVDLSPAKYAEVECGNVEWLGPDQESNIPALLSFNESKKADFTNMLSTARQLPPLAFSDIFSREEMSPARCCTATGHQIDAQIKEAILNAVFAPLPRDD